MARKAKKKKVSSFVQQRIIRQRLAQIEDREAWRRSKVYRPDEPGHWWPDGPVNSVRDLPTAFEGQRRRH